MNEFLRALFDNRRFSWIAVLTWAAAIFALSAQPSLSTHLGTWDFILRKTAHVCEFAVLSLLVWNAVRLYGLPRGFTMGLASAVAFLYACSDEFHQKFVSGRNGTPRDVAIDSAGIILMGIAIYALQSRKGTDGSPQAG